MPVMSGGLSKFTLEKPAKMSGRAETGAFGDFAQRHVGSLQQ